MYEAVVAHPEGDATVSRFALTAREYGYDGIVVRNAPDVDSPVDAGDVADETNVDVVRGVEIDADDPDAASGYLGTYRSECTILSVRGGTEALNRFAIEQSRVDVLARPMAGDGDLDHVLVRRAAENGVRLEFDLGRVMDATGGTRVRAIQQLAKLRDLVDDADAPFVVSGTPRSHLELRAPRELRAVGSVVGLGEDLIEEGLAEWGRLAERNRRRTDDRFVEPGVTVVRSTDRRCEDGAQAEAVDPTSHDGEPAGCSEGGDRS